MNLFNQQVSKAMALPLAGVFSLTATSRGQGLVNDASDRIQPVDSTNQLIWADQVNILEKTKASNTAASGVGVRSVQSASETALALKKLGFWYEGRESVI